MKIFNINGIQTSRKIRTLWDSELTERPISTGSYRGKAVLKNKRLMTPSVTDKVKLRLNDMITKLDDSAL